MGRTFQQIITLIRQNITDPLLRQNTAKRTREVMEAFAADYFNKQSDTLQINQIDGLDQALSAAGINYAIINQDIASNIPDTTLNTQNQYNDWVLGYLRLLAGNITTPAKPANALVDDIGDTLSVDVVPGFITISDYQGYSPYTGGTVILTNTTGYIQNNRVYFKVVGPAGIDNVGIGVAASGSRPAGPFATNKQVFTGVVVTTPAGDTISPNISFIAPASGASIAPNTAITLTVTATDNVAVQGVTFTNGTTGTALGSGAKNGNTYTFPYTTGLAGPLALVATATDAAGNSQSATINITVQAAQNPSTKATAPSFGVIDDVNNIVTLTSQYAYTEVRWGVEGQGPQALASNSICSPGNITGRLFAYVVADAGSNRLQSDTVFSTAFSLAATANNAPTATISVVGGGSSVPTGQSVTLNLAGQDSDGTIVKLELLDNGVKVGEVAGASGALQSPALTAGPHNFTARAVDDKGATGLSLAVTVTAGTGTGKNGYFYVQFGDSRVGYPGNTGTEYTTSTTALVQKRFVDAGKSDITYLKYGWPGWTASDALTNTGANGNQYSSTKPNGVTAVNDLISQLPADKYVIIQVGFLANGGEVADVKAVHDALKASGKVDYTIGTLVLNRLDQYFPSGLPNRAAKNSAVMAGVGLWNNGYSHTDNYPQIYSDEAPNNSFYFWSPDFVGLSKVHLTTEGNKLQAEADAQELARIIGFTLPALPTSTSPLTSISIEQDSNLLTYYPAGQWQAFSANPAYSSGTGGACNATDSYVSFTGTFYGVRFVTPRSNLGTALELVIDGQVVATGTCYSASPPTSADPLTVIMSKVYASAAKRTVIARRAAGGTNTNYQFNDLIQFSDANGIFPDLPTPGVGGSAPAPSVPYAYLDFGGLMGTNYNATNHIIADITSATAWGNSVARGSTLIAASGATEKGRIRAAFMPSGIGAVASTVFGLTGTGATGNSYTDIQYAFYVDAQGSWGIIQNGTFVVPSTAPGTLPSGTYANFEIIVSAVVDYWLNGVKVYTSGLAPSLPLLTKACFEGNGFLYSVQLSAAATAASAYPLGTNPAPPVANPLQDVAYASLVNATVSGNTITKTSGGTAVADSSWDAGGVGTLRIDTTSGSGEKGRIKVPLANFTAVNNGVFIALSSSPTAASSQHYSNMTYGVYPTPPSQGAANQLQAWKNGTALKTGGILTGDVEIVAYDNRVECLINGALFYTWAEAPAFPLTVDVALFELNKSAFSGVQISGVNLIS
jgi:hypothetical protein